MPRSSQRGAALVIVCSLIAVFLVLVAAFVPQRLVGYRTARMMVERSRAYYLAAGGLAFAKRNLKADPRWMPGDSAPAEQISAKKGSGTFKVTVGDFAGLRRVASKGDTGGKSATLHELYCRRYRERADSSGILAGIDSSALRSAMAVCEGRLSSPKGARETQGCVYNEDNPFNPGGAILIYVWGDVSFEGGYPDRPLVIKGPGRIMASGGIEVAEFVKITGFSLLARGDIVFQDHAEGADCLAYTGRKFVVEEDAAFSGEAFAGGEIFVRDRAKVLPYSVLYQDRLKSDSSEDESKPGITIEGGAAVTATLIANAGPVAMEPGVKVQGLVFWSAGSKSGARKENPPAGLIMPGIFEGTLSPFRFHEGAILFPSGIWEGP